MSLTIGLFIVVLIILPGLVAIARYNQRSGKAGVRRSEMPLTAVSTLAVAVIFSILVHGIAWGATGAISSMLDAAGASLQTYPLGPSVGNPIEDLYLALASDTILEPRSALVLAAIYGIEIVAIVHFVGSDAFGVMLDGFDAGSHGWVYQHITRPAEYGYTPIATVFTKTTYDNMGIAYVGPVIDVRQGSDGTVLSIALSQPERFLYRTETKPPQNRLKALLGSKEASAESGFKRYERTYVGGVIALSGSEIANLNVRVVANDLLEEHADRDGFGQ